MRTKVEKLAQMGRRQKLKDEKELAVHSTEERVLHAEGAIYQRGGQPARGAEAHAIGEQAGSARTGLLVIRVGCNLHPGSFYHLAFHPTLAGVLLYFSHWFTSLLPS